MTVLLHVHDNVYVTLWTGIPIKRPLLMLLRTTCVFLMQILESLHVAQTVHVTNLLMVKVILTLFGKF